MLVAKSIKLVFPIELVFESGMFEVVRRRGELGPERPDHPVAPRILPSSQGASLKCPVSGPPKEFFERYGFSDDCRACSNISQFGSRKVRLMVELVACDTKLGCWRKLQQTTAWVSRCLWIRLQRLCVRLFLRQPRMSRGMTELWLRFRVLLSLAQLVGTLLRLRLRQGLRTMQLPVVVLLRVVRIGKEKMPKVRTASDELAAALGRVPPGNRPAIDAIAVGWGLPVTAAAKIGERSLCNLIATCYVPGQE